MWMWFGVGEHHSPRILTLQTLRKRGTPGTHRGWFVQPLCTVFVLCHWDLTCALTRGTAKFTARRQCVPTQIILSSPIKCQSIGNANRNSTG
ncbi:hypothetical protein CY34DRAFT_720172 [Suillus luteus UH-Slu-Lm8-n1]|uniref:Uncharacterized protein n=1 Tax=Suillus luteus UH-Slu-Lm8-n1 TaxID=930992 RepID=A0A0D0AGA1_9AGAM|nr:hypothetical protein CY34DRAFT_720172 [Suillus luteus UH-Slu-Lm8-n1]